MTWDDQRLPLTAVIACGPLLLGAGQELTKPLDINTTQLQEGT